MKKDITEEELSNLVSFINKLNEFCMIHDKLVEDTRKVLNENN